MKIIADASVAAKWFLHDEENRQAALKIQDDFRNRAISIHIPVIFYYEVNNLLKSACTSKRITSKQAKEFYFSLLDLEFVAFYLKDLMKRVLEKAIDLDISAYDASYVALAEYLEIPLYTYDQKLVNKAKSKLVRNADDYFASQQQTSS